MPLPKGTISLQNPNAANAGMQASTKVAMLVRLPAEAYAALEHATDIEVVNDGPTPGIKIADTFYALHHAPETHPHELILQARTPNKSNPPLKTHAQIVHKMVPPPARSDASSAYARAAAAAEAPRKSTAMIESVVPVVPINAPGAKVAPKKAAASGAAKRKPGSAAGNVAARQRASGSGSGGGAFVLGGKDERLSASTSRATTRPSTPSLSTTNTNNNTKAATSSRASPMPPPPAPMPRSRLATSTAPEPTSAEKGEIVLAKMAPSEREALRMRMVHEVAKGARRPRSREDLRQSLSGIDWHAFKSLLSEVAEPSPPIRTAPDKETTWALKPRAWRDVRPYAAPPDVLSAKEANLVAEYADAVFDKQGLPHDHPAREAVRPRQPGSSSYPSSALASGSPYAGRSPSYGATSGGVALSSKPLTGSGLPPKPPGLPPKPIGAPLPPINSSRQRMSPMPPPKADSRAGSVAGTPRGRREADAGRDSEREEGEMDEDEPARPPSTSTSTSTTTNTITKKSGSGAGSGTGAGKEPDAKRRRVDAKERNASPPPPSPSVLKKSGKRAREEEPDAVPRRAGREREREEPPRKKVTTIKREPSPLPPPPSQASKKKVSSTTGISSPELSRKPRERSEREKEREREETPNTTARRKRGREVDFTSDEDSDEMPRRISSTSTKGKARESDRERESEKEGARAREVGARKIAPIPRKSTAVGGSGNATPAGSVRPVKEKERVGVKERSTPVHSKEGVKPVVKHDDRDRERPAKHDDHPRVRETERERDRDRPVQPKPKPKPQPPKREPSPDLEDSSSSRSRSSSPLPSHSKSKSKFMPSDLGPLPSTADGLRARMRTAYKHYYQAHAACEEQKEVILAALKQGDYEEGQERQERRGPRLCSEKTVLEMYGVYEAWRDEVLRVKSAAEGLGGGKEEEGA